MNDPELMERIRSIFLHEQPYVSIRDAADLPGWSRNEMRGAIEASEIEVARSCAGDTIEREELLAQAVARWPVEWIEDALAASAAKLLPEGVRTKTTTVRLPRYRLAMLAYLAEQQGTTEGHLIAHALDGLMSEHFEKLAASIPAIVGLCAQFLCTQRRLIAGPGIVTLAAIAGAIFALSVVGRSPHVVPTTATIVVSSPGA